MEKLKVLALTQADRMPNYDYFYQQMGKQITLDWHKLNKSQQSNLKDYFKTINLSNYNRIFLELRFKKTLKQKHFIASLPNLIEYEHDACQNYHVNGKYENAWRRYYGTLSNFRAISSGFNVAKKLRREGYDVVFIPKPYNEKEISNISIKRDIKLGFIGRTEKMVYRPRKLFLNKCEKELGLKLLRVNPGKAYNHCLNRIQFFISADIDIGEYMVKNFEALAAGCILCAYRQGHGEEEALGLIDMENVLLYTNLQELKQKITFLCSHPDKKLEIACNGQKHAEQYFSIKTICKKTIGAMLEPIKTHRKLTIKDQCLAHFGW